MPITYEPIATTTLGSAAASVTFSTISGAYTDLVLVASLKNTANTRACELTFNGDISGTTYSVTRLYGNGSTATSDRFSSQSFIDSGFFGTPDFQMTIIQIQNYSNSTTNKTVLARWNSEGSSSGNRYVAAVVGLWRDTNAITSLRLKPTTDNWATGSTFTLYGIKAA